jgi:hypothetical protein
MNISKVFCFLHGKEFIGLDTHIFKLICRKCIEMNIENRDIYLYTNKDKPKQENNAINKESNQDSPDCVKHSNEKAIFYCDDCKDFICKTCFASDHRSHNSTTNKILAETLRKTLKKDLGTLHSLHLDEPLKVLIEIGKKIKEMKYQADSKNDNLRESIMSSLKIKMKSTIKSFNELNKGVDIDLQNLEERVVCLIKNINKNIRTISDGIQIMNLAASDYLKCKFHKEFQQKLKSINQSLEELNHFFNDKLINKMQKIGIKSPLITESFHKFIKDLQTTEFSIISSIQSGITTQSIRLRRFVRYNLMCRYYKTSSLEVNVNKPLTLVGLGLCGLLEHSVQKVKKGFSKSEDKENIDINILPKEFTYLKQYKETDSVSLPLTISIKEKRKGDYDKEMLEFKVKMHSLTNSADPVLVFYFPKAVNLRSDTTYLITITNNDKNHMYLHIFGGSVPKINQDKLEQNIICNNSGIDFKFLAVNDIESDFNEFNFGLITDLLYCYVE